MKFKLNKLFSRTTDKNKLLNSIGNRVYSGPFSGLGIPDSIGERLTVPEILGLYESCMHKYILKTVNNKLNTIMVIGANYGYYVTGLNYLCNPEKIFAFEMDENFHPYIKEWSSHNSLAAPVVSGKADIQLFESITEPIDFIICDCEGYEIELLNPGRFDWQKESIILVELHPFYRKNLMSTIIKNFKDSHNIEIFEDDFSENRKIENLSKAFNYKTRIDLQPYHRWISEHNKKVYTCGLFMYLTPNNYDK
jgi:hypothetical protein